MIKPLPSFKIRMLSKEISSLQHPIVKHFVNLRKNRNYRDESGTVCILGSTLIEEISPFTTYKKILLEKSSPPPKNVSCEDLYLVPKEIIQKITGMENPPNAIAECLKPPFHSLANKNFILVLDKISDPGNLGTLLRSALALGWDGVFITKDSCDPFNDKALQAAKGATFKIPLEIGLLEEWMNHKRNYYLADTKGKPLDDCNIKAPLALILGNEAHGASRLAKDRSEIISIPIHQEMESLNVASAGAILLYELRKTS